MIQFYMKNLIPNGKGAWTVHRFAANTEADEKRVRDALEGSGDWGVADQKDWDEWTAALDAVAGVLTGEEWISTNGLGEAQKKMMRAISQGQNPCPPCKLDHASEGLDGESEAPAEEPVA